jgi:hypothetical protein
MVATLRGCLSDNGISPQVELGIPMFRKTSVIRWLFIVVAFVSTKKQVPPSVAILYMKTSRSFNFEVWNMGRITTGKRCPSRFFHLGCPIRNSGDHWQVSAQELGLWLICQFLRKVLFFANGCFLFWVCFLDLCSPASLLFCFFASLLRLFCYVLLRCFCPLFVCFSNRNKPQEAQ